MQPEEFFLIVDNIKNQINTLSNEIYRIREQVKNLDLIFNQMSNRLENSRDQTPTIESNIKWINIKLNEVDDELKDMDRIIKGILNWKATREGQLTVWIWLANGLGLGSIALHFFDK